MFKSIVFIVSIHTLWSPRGMSKLNWPGSRRDRSDVTFSYDPVVIPGWRSAAISCSPGENMNPSGNNDSTKLGPVLVFYGVMGQCSKFARIVSFLCSTNVVSFVLRQKRKAWAGLEPRPFNIECIVVWVFAQYIFLETVTVLYNICNIISVFWIKNTRFNNELLFSIQGSIPGIGTMCSCTHTHALGKISALPSYWNSNSFQ